MQQSETKRFFVLLQKNWPVGLRMEGKEEEEGEKEEGERGRRERGGGGGGRGGGQFLCRNNFDRRVMKLIVMLCISISFLSLFLSCSFYLSISIYSYINKSYS